MPEAENPLRQLELPRRYELLVERASKAEVDPGEIVERVDDAANRVDALLRRVRDGGGGVIEVFFGLSGSGKTTFLQTLSRFFEGIRVSTFPKASALTQLPEFIRADYNELSPVNRVVLIERRDNPTQAELAQVEEMFGELLDLFRQPDGAVVVLWPITKPDSAEKVAQAAWAVGRDSMADVRHGGKFPFSGVPKNRYWDLADNTSRTLTGDGLEAYGITQQEATEVLINCKTISDFFNQILEIASARRNEIWSVLRVRPITHLWVLIPGDDVRLVNATADALTQGVRSKIDIDKIGELIDRPDQDTIYIKDWKDRRGKLAHLLRAIDVRLFGVPPNVSLAAVRAFGESVLKEKLRQPNTQLSAAKDAMRASRLYKAILNEMGVATPAYAGPRQIGKEAVEEFLRIQRTASKDDKPLNKALGALIAACLEEDAPNAKVVSEKKSLTDSALQPDIQIEVRPNEFICLEPTWRTSGSGIEGEINPAQNTLSEAHVRKYVLDKATQYVKDVGL